MKHPRMPFSARIRTPRSDSRSPTEGREVRKYNNPSHKRKKMVRRSKRKSTELLLREHGGQLRRSKRTASKKDEEQAIYGDDFGILPSD